MTGGTMTTKGGQIFQAIGKNFGPKASNIIFKIGNLNCTNVTWKSDSQITLVTPPLTGTEASKFMPVVVIAGSQSNEINFNFSYAPPTITSVTVIAQKILNNAKGIKLEVYGTEFANVPLSSIKILGVKDSTEIECLNVRRVSYEELHCEYPQEGRGSSGFNVQVEIAGQRSNVDQKLMYCNDVVVSTQNINTAKTILTGVTEEGSSMNYKVVLETPLASPTGTVTINTTIIDGSNYCTLIQPLGTIIRTYQDFSTPFNVDIDTKEALGDVSTKCIVLHTITSDDPCYAFASKTFQKEFEITMTSKVCQCKNGDPAKDDQCPSNGADLCERCNTDFVMSSDKSICIGVDKIQQLPAPFDLVVSRTNKDTATISFKFDSTRQKDVHNFQVSIQLPTERPNLIIPAKEHSFQVSNLTLPLWHSIIRVKITAHDTYGLSGVVSDPLLPWTTGSKCDARQYLDETSDDLFLWKCLPCPDGADCTASTPWFGVKALFGYFRIPNTLNNSNLPTTFERCLYPGACLGAPNLEFSNTYYDVDDKKNDLSKLSNFTESCNMNYGFKHTSRLCHTCNKGFSRVGLHRCKGCPKQASANVLLILFGIIVAALILFYLVRITINVSTVFIHIFNLFFVGFF